jgi:hypothetical protein
MKTYAECVKEYDDRVAHRPDIYMIGFIDAIAFIFGKNRAQVVKDTQDLRSQRAFEEEEN